MADLPLILLHAYPFDARMWDPVRRPLAQRLRLITPDQRGLGRTPLPETDREPSLEDAALDVLALLDKLELDRVVLGGCSMGGYLTMALLRMVPDRVAGLVLINTKASADTPEAARNRLTTAERAESDGIKGWLADSMVPNLLAPQAPAPLAEAVRDLIESQPPSGVAWALRAMAARPDSFDILSATRVPTLVVVGEEDTLTPPDAAQAMVDAMPTTVPTTVPNAVPNAVPTTVPNAVPNAMAGPGSAARSVTSAVAGSAARDRDTPGETADAVPAAELVRIPGAGHLSPLEAPAALSSAILSWWSRVW